MYWNSWILINPLIAPGLTLTWDVLKCWRVGNIAHPSNGLTLTWDVLKLENPFLEHIVKFWLTLTWDVLKYIPLGFLNIF